MKQAGKRSKLISAIRALVWPRVLKRDNWACVGCGKPARAVRLTWAHVFGRGGTGAGLGDWAHVPELAFSLCWPSGGGGCHQQFDLRLNKPLREKLERLALDNFHAAYKGRILKSYTPLEMIRTLVRRLEEKGKKPADFLPWWPAA